jgi:hypothetical protein
VAEKYFFSSDIPLGCDEDVYSVSSLIIIKYLKNDGKNRNLINF